MKPTLLFLTLTATLLAAEADPANLARAKGAVPFGSGSNGPFTITKINDGRLDTMGMWSTPGTAGSFGGVKLGNEPVAFNTVRFYLFNARSAFTGWRLEGSDDCEIDEDTNIAEFYDPELIAADPEGEFANTQSKENNVVTINFKSVKFKYVRLIFPNKSAPVGIPEIQVFNRTASAKPNAAAADTKDIRLDVTENPIRIAGSVKLSLLVKLLHAEDATIAAYDSIGNSIKDSDLVKNESLVLIRRQTGGKDAPFQIDYTSYTVIDPNAPPPAPKPPKVSRPPKPPKPPVSPASAPAAPKDTPNLILGKTITASFKPEAAAAYAKSGGGDWFLGQRFPQWVSIDLGAEIEFNYFSLNAVQVIRFCVQSSTDGEKWTTLVEVDHQRPPWPKQWNGVFEKTKARHLRVVILPPSWDVHLKKITLANLASPLKDAEGNPVPLLKSSNAEIPELSNLPK